MLNVWYIVFFCLTPENAECMAMNNKSWPPQFEVAAAYHDKEFCDRHADIIIQTWWEHHHFSLRAECREMREF